MQEPHPNVSTVFLSWFWEPTHQKFLLILFCFKSI